MQHESSRKLGMTHVCEKFLHYNVSHTLTYFFLDEKVAKNQGCIQFLTLFVPNLIRDSLK